MESLCIKEDTNYLPGLPPAEYKCKIYNEREIEMSENKFSSKEVIARCVPMSRLQSVIGGKGS